MDKLQKLIECIEEEYNNVKDGHSVSTIKVLRYILEIARKIEAQDIPLPEGKPIWTPTPGERIEVSEDAVRWETRKFIKMERKFFSCRIPNSLDSFRWKYARPRTVEIEEVPPSLHDGDKMISCEGESEEETPAMAWQEWPTPESMPPFNIPKIELPREYKLPIFFSSGDSQLQALTESLREVIKVVNILNK